MRLHLSKTLRDCYFLHADMWNIQRFPMHESVTVINCGLGESNLLNVAGGIASQGHDVYIYGVCGFIIHRLEQLKFSCVHFGAKHGKIIICNAGKYGYENLGIGHVLDDDKQIMSMYQIPFYEPETIAKFNEILSIIKIQKNGIYYIRLERDG